MTTAHGLQVTVRLPVTWRVVPTDEWPPEIVDVSRLHHADLGIDVPGPDLVASTFAPVVADDDAVARLREGDVSAADYLMLAGLTLTTVPLAAVPEVSRGRREPWVSRRRIAIGTVEASFDVGTYVRVAPDHALAALLTISTPNLEQSAELIHGFSGIADSMGFRSASS